MSPLEKHLNDHVQIEVVLMDSQDQINLNYSFTIDVVKPLTLQNQNSFKNGPKVKLSRVRASSNGYLKFKVKSMDEQVLTSTLIDKMTSSTFRLSIPARNLTEVKYSVIQKDPTTGLVVVKLEYPDRKKISSS